MAVDKTQSGVNDPRGARRLRTLQRQARALELRIAGHTYSQIGADLGISPQAAYKLIDRALTRLHTRIDGRAETERELELLRLDRWLQIADSAVQAGNIDAINQCLRIQERRAKLLGLDAMPPPADLHIKLKWSDDIGDPTLDD